jgi:hypothetical protein
MSGRQTTPGLKQLRCPGIQPAKRHPGARRAPACAAQPSRRRLPRMQVWRTEEQREQAEEVMKVINERKPDSL